MKVFGSLVVALGMIIGGAAIAAGMAPMTPPATKPAATTSQPAALACCGDACKKMGADCCKADDKGKVTCSMGGTCCVKADTKPADTKPAGGMGGMDMGK